MRESEDDAYDRVRQEEVDAEIVREREQAAWERFKERNGHWWRT